MFTLKFDFLFPDLKAFKDLAKRLNRETPPRADFDPRQLQLMQDELRAARESVKVQAILHRYHVI
jgi:hypothetical protein